MLEYHGCNSKTLKTSISSAQARPIIVLPDQQDGDEWYESPETRPHDLMDCTGWFLYALRCADGTLYTGVTTDLARRLKEHNSGHGARYTAGRRPVALTGAWRFADRGAAQRAEARFRRLPRRKKLQHIAGQHSFAGSPFCTNKVVMELLSPIHQRDKA